MGRFTLLSGKGELAPVAGALARGSLPTGTPAHGSDILGGHVSLGQRNVGLFGPLLTLSLSLHHTPPSPAGTSSGPSNALLAAEKTRKTTKKMRKARYFPCTLAVK